MKRFRKIFAAVILIALLVSANHIIAQTWTSLNGPQIAKNVKDISLSGNFVYIAEQDYLLKSTNGGTAWRATTSVFTTPSVVLCKPTDANIIIGSRQNFFKRSTDGGNSWDNVIPSTIVNNLTPLRLSASTVNTSNMFLGRKYDASTRSVWRSLTSGAIWSPCDNFTWSTDVHDVAPYPVPGVGRNDELWVCGSDPGGLMKSGSRSTSSVASTSGIWYSANAGLNWQAKTMGDYNIRSVAVIHKVSNPHLFAATSDGEIYKSTNYGVDWTLNYSTGKNVRLVRVNRNTTLNTIFLATNNGIYRSLDEGANWSITNTGLGTDLDILSLAIQPLSNTIIIGTANSTYKSTDNGGTWVNVGMMNCSSVDASGNLVWTVTRDNAYTGKFDGTSWLNYYLQSVGANFSSNHIYRDSPTNYMFVSGSYISTIKAILMK